MELAFTLASYAITLYALHLLRKVIEQNARLFRQNTELRNAIEWRDEVIENLEDEEAEIDVECDCERCVARERWALN